jgi:hypothetical protein
MTATGFKMRPITDGGFTVSVALFDKPPAEAVSVAAVTLPTPNVLMLNVAEFWPAATTTLAGNLTELLFEERLIVVPAEPAEPVRLTVPVDEFPP